MRKATYVLMIGAAGGIAVLFLFGSFYTVANHYFSFDPNKVAVEFEASMLFAAGYLWIAIVAGGCCVVLSRRYRRIKRV